MRPKFLRSALSFLSRLIHKDLQGEMLNVGKIHNTLFPFGSRHGIGVCKGKPHQLLCHRTKAHKLRK